MTAQANDKPTDLQVRDNTFHVVIESGKKYSIDSWGTWASLE